MTDYVVLPVPFSDGTNKALSLATTRAGGFSDDEIRFTREWLRSKANSIEGGTSEIQLNIIAKRVLGLPD